MYKIFCINPGSTSTRLAMFEDSKRIWYREARHTADDLFAFSDIQDQLDYRMQMTRALLDEDGVSLAGIAAIAGRGGAMRPGEGGTYEVNELMIEDCKTAKYAGHPSNLGCQMALLFAKECGVKAYITDPPMTDEFCDEARVTGLANTKRMSAFHALNEKYAARLACDELGVDYFKTNLITVHLGSGISLTAHKLGRCIDNNYGLCGDGPFSPERCGALPTMTFLEKVHSSDLCARDWKKALVKKAGLVDYTGTNDILMLMREIEEGSEYTAMAIDAMISEIAKEIGAYAAILSGQVDAVVLTGAIARCDYITKRLAKRVSCIAQVFVYPGEFEMEALARGALGAVSGRIQAKTYE